MIKIFIFSFFLLSFSLSAQQLIKKDSALYLFYENDTFPTKVYRSVKLYRYYVADYLYLHKSFTPEQVFAKTNWDVKMQQQFVQAYKKECKFCRKTFKRPHHKLTHSDSVMVLHNACKNIIPSIGMSDEIVRDSLVLSGQILENVLTCFVNDGSYMEYQPIKCGYYWRHQIVFFDENGKECERIKICFSCGQVEGIKLNNVYDAIPKLREQIKSMGIKMSEFGNLSWKGD